MKTLRKKLMRASLALSFGLAAAALAIFSCGTNQQAAKNDKTGSSATDTSDKEVTFTWDAYSGSVDSFKIYVSETEDGDFVSLGTIDAKDDSFDADSPQATFTTKRTKKLKNYVGGDACFKVTALKGDAESSASNIACATL